MRRVYPSVSRIRLKTKHFRDFRNSFFLIEKRASFEDFTNSSSRKKLTKGTKPRKDTCTLSPYQPKSSTPPEERLRPAGLI